MKINRRQFFYYFESQNVKRDQFAKVKWFFPFILEKIRRKFNQFLLNRPATCKLHVCKPIFIEFNLSKFQNVPQIKWHIFSHLQMNTFWKHFEFWHNGRNGFCFVTKLAQLDQSSNKLLKILFSASFFIFSKRDFSSQALDDTSFLST